MINAWLTTTDKLFFIEIGLCPDLERKIYNFIFRNMEQIQVNKP